MRDFFVTMYESKGYLREGNYCYPLNDNFIAQGALVESREKKPMGNLAHHAQDFKLIFLETNFEPISRIKRGKFYLLANEAQPSSLYRYPGDSSILSVNGDSGSNSVSAYKFTAYELSRDFDIRKTFVYFGNSRLKSKWKILGADSIISNEEVYVLQEVNGIGAIPALNKLIIPAGHYEEIEKEYAALLAELHASPESVIEHCRDVAISLLSAKTGLSGEHRKDLGKLINKIGDELRIVKSCAELINTFHPRRKPNEKDKHGLSDLTHSDADFAVQAVFQIIKELKWASE